MTQGNAMDLYLKEVIDIINHIHAQEKEHILAAARLVADQVKQDKIIHVWGPGGHSNLGAMEIFFRAGGLMHINAILNQDTMLNHGALKSMSVERLPGYGRIVINDCCIGKGDLLLLVNAYGINAAVIDAALQAKENGATVIGVSSHQHANECPKDHPARHPSKQNLHELVDCAVDCKIQVGDAVLELPGFEQKIGPLSTYANAYALNCIILEAINMLVDEGVNPPVWRSGNAPGGDEWNNQFLGQFRNKIKML